jgi:hypothetical protein
MPTPAASPRPRTPAQIEAARTNGAKSRGPLTPEGKARSSRNALKHGLAALEHHLLPDEDPAGYERLLTRLWAEHAPATETEARLVRRLAAAFWKQERAERLLAALLAAPPRHELDGRPGALAIHPQAALHLARFQALRAYDAQLGREVARCLRELRLLKATPLPAAPEAEDEPEAQPRAEPEPPAANENRENEPEPPPPAEPWPAALDALVDSGAFERLLVAASESGRPDLVAPLYREVRQRLAKRAPHASPLPRSGA